VKDDVRTPAKLIDGVNDTDDGRHMWLVPVFPGLVRFEIKDFHKLMLEQNL
jgi:hypothetical protein